jgi:dTDP-4-dehydrorhamnose 3,5-epimerase-like enzyme
MDVRIIPLERRADARGWFLKVLMRQQLDGDRTFGEIYLSVAEAGQARGAHYHQRTTEWFCLIGGTATLSLCDTATGERRAVDLDALRPAVVVVPPGRAHAFSNAGPTPAMLLAYSDVPYDPRDPDTIPFDF